MNYKEKVIALLNSQELSKEQKEKLENIFPELKEDVDELTWLKSYIKEEVECLSMDIRDTEDSRKLEKLQKSLAWLEKQGLQQDCVKNIDKVEPKSVDEFEAKFKVGQWIVNNKSNDVFLIKSFNNGYCTLEDIKGNIFSPCELPFEDDYNIWTIEDAKDGDVVITNINTQYEWLGLFKEKTGETFSTHCHYSHYTDKLVITPARCKNHGCGKYSDIQPATKEQRDLLFQKMEKAGYEWDSDNKKLKKIKYKFNVDDWIVTDDSFGKIVRHVDEIRSNLIDEGYVVSDEYGLLYNISFSNEHKWHKWTIRDAENGDVLVCNINKSEIGGDTEKLPNITPTICIYQNVDKDHDYIHSYCSLYDGKYLVPQNRMYYNTFVHNIRPANKEQRDFLFQKIKNDGYEWDNENKEMRKQTLKITPKFCVGQLITDDNGTWYKITNIKCLDDWYYEVYDACEDYVCEDSTHLELCSIIDEKFRANSFVHEIKKMLGD